MAKELDAMPSLFISNERDETIEKYLCDYLESDMHYYNYSQFQEFESILEIADCIILSTHLSENEFKKVKKHVNDTSKLYFFNTNYFASGNIPYDPQKLLFGYNEYRFLDKIQIPIAEHCNLNCNRCYHFSNLQNQEKFYDFEIFKSDLKCLKDFGFEINEIRFLGGEPLLSDELFDFIELASSIFPYTNMKIITNGVKLINFSDEYLNKIKDSKAIISISVYPPVMKYIDSIESKLINKNIPYEIFRVGNVFNKILMEEENKNFVSTAEECEKCIMIYNGVVTRCAPSIFINIFNEKLDCNFPEEEFDRVYDFDSRREMLQYLDRPFELCHYCMGDSDPIGYEWERTDSKRLVKKDYIR